MRLARACCLAALVVLAAVPAFGAAGLAAPADRAVEPRPADGTGASAAVGPGSNPATAIEADRIEFRITVYPNGSGRWTFTYTRILENESERERFEAFAEEFEANETDAYRAFEESARALTARGRNATGREMRATDFSRSAGLGGNCIPSPNQACGTVEMSFTWTAFARQDGQRVVVDDVFGTGLQLLSDQEMVFVAGEGLRFESAEPGDYAASGGSLENSTSITYAGERSFSDNRPRVVFLPASSESPAPEPTATPSGGDGTADGTGDGAGSPTPATPGDGGGMSPFLLGGLAVVVLGLGAAASWYRRGGGAVRTAGDDSGGDAGGAVATDPDQESGGSAIPDEELLTDEDRVMNLLEDNDGRMKQVDIVEETGWSKSKVSMLLSDMEDDGEISKLRVGRENIISIAGQEPEAAGSPHDED